MAQVNYKLVSETEDFRGKKFNLSVNGFYDFNNYRIYFIGDIIFSLNHSIINVIDIVIQEDEKNKALGEMEEWLICTIECDEDLQEKLTNELGE